MTVTFVTLREMPKSKIKNLERIEQPREKFLKYGVGKLSNEELLAILLRTGKEGSNVVEVAKQVFRKFPGTKLANSTVAELKKIDGVGPVKALEILACFELGRRLLKDKQMDLVLSPSDVWHKMEKYRSSKKEHFVVFFLDTQNGIIKDELISIGTLNSSLTHPREIFEPAIKHSSSHIIVSHNHPSGSLEPSDEYLFVTKRLKDAGALLGIQLLDHVIVTTTSYHSLKEYNEL